VSCARSNAEFISKIDGLLQEADESQLWIELLHEDGCDEKWVRLGCAGSPLLITPHEDCALSGAAVDFFLSETNQHIAIFVTIASKSRSHTSFQYLIVSDFRFSSP